MVGGFIAWSGLHAASIGLCRHTLARCPVCRYVADRIGHRMCRARSRLGNPDQHAGTRIAAMCVWRVAPAQRADRGADPCNLHHLAGAV